MREIGHFGFLKMFELLLSLPKGEQGEQGPRGPMVYGMSRLQIMNFLLTPWLMLGSYGPERTSRTTRSARHSGSKGKSINRTSVAKMTVLFGRDLLEPREKMEEKETVECLDNE